MANPNIAIIGLEGSGKTVLGFSLADKPFWHAAIMRH